MDDEIGVSATCSRGRASPTLPSATSARARLEIVPGATHLFEEPGTLAQAADLALAWFDRFLGK
jgi:hypothetical protein